MDQGNNAHPSGIGDIASYALARPGVRVTRAESVRGADHLTALIDISRDPGFAADSILPVQPAAPSGAALAL